MRPALLIPNTDGKKSESPGHTSEDFEHEYAYYFPEGSGYLFVDRLGQGADGVADLVWSCEEAALAYHKRDVLSSVGIKARAPELDKVHFVRKKTAARLEDEEFWPGLVEEVKHYRPHGRIPVLLDWVEYHPLPRTHEHHLALTSYSMIFQYCNGGTLGDVTDAYQNLNKILQTTSQPNAPPPPTVRIPESFIFIVFGQLLQVVDWLHHQRPAIAHCDIHLRNIFLHFSRAGQLMPNCFLGDFGRSMTFDPVQWNTQGVPTSMVIAPILSDYQDVWTVVVELMTLNTSGQTADLHRDFADALAHSDYYSDLLFDQVRRYGNLMDDAANDRSNPDFASLAQRLIAYGEALNGLRQESLRNTSQRYPGDPLTFQTMEELVHHSSGDKCPAGPWKIAKVRRDNKAVVALSREVYRTYRPRGRFAERQYYHSLRGGGDHSIPGSSRDTSVSRL